MGCAFLARRRGGERNLVHPDSAVYSVRSGASDLGRAAQVIQVGDTECSQRLSAGRGEPAELGGPEEHAGPDGDRRIGAADVAEVPDALYGVVGGDAFDSALEIVTHPR